MPAPDSKPTAELPVSEADFKRTIFGVLGKFVRFWWGDRPDGALFDPIPNPKRYLNIGLFLGSIKLVVALDFGNPGWLRNSQPGK